MKMYGTWCLQPRPFSVIGKQGPTVPKEHKRKGALVEGPQSADGVGGRDWANEGGPLLGKMWEDRAAALEWITAVSTSIFTGLLPVCPCLCKDISHTGFGINFIPLWSHFNLILFAFTSSVWTLLWGTLFHQGYASSLVAELGCQFSLLSLSPGLVPNTGWLGPSLSSSSH